MPVLLFPFFMWCHPLQPPPNLTSHPSQYLWKQHNPLLIPRAHRDISYLTSFYILYPLTGILSPTLFTWWTPTQPSKGIHVSLQLFSLPWFSPLLQPSLWRKLIISVSTVPCCNLLEGVHFCNITSAALFIVYVPNAVPDLPLGFYKG